MQIRSATNYLISAERILKPRDGQIEAKGKQVEAGKYTLPFTRLILQHIALQNLGRLEEAIASYEQAIKIKPDKDEAWYSKAYCYGLLGNIDLAIENLQQAINLNPEWREIAKTDTNFDNIQEYQRFQDLISR